tara:strand:- start:70867 stop:71301 length:435 start_codon:yes stop_codon:yes gene_type:complete
MNERSIPGRAQYKVFYPITTRWSDNDIYGHVNNVTYYSYFDTAANRYLIEQGGLDISDGSIVGFVVSSGCEYHAPITYPEPIEAGLRVDRMGKSSVQYGIAIFREGESEAVAHGHFVHVFVERAHNRSVAIPHGLRSALEKISA